jgi:hypothetical protein
MCLRFVLFTDFAFRVSTSSVEVAEGSMANTVSSFIVPYDLLDHELTPTVGVDGLLLMVFRYGDGIWNTVSRARARKDEITTSLSPHRIQEANRPGNVIAIVFVGRDDRFTHIGESRKVKDCHRSIGSKHMFEESTVMDVSLDEGPPLNCPLMTIDEIINGNRKKPPCRQRLAGMTSDVAGSSCN